MNVAWRTGAALLFVPLVTDVAVVTAPSLVDGGLGIVLTWGGNVAALIGAAMLLLGSRHRHVRIHTALAAGAAVMGVARVAAFTWGHASATNIGAGIVVLAAGALLAVIALVTLAQQPREGG